MNANVHCIKTEPDYFSFQPRFDYIELNERNSRWPHHDKGLLKAGTFTTLIVHNLVVFPFFHLLNRSGVHRGHAFDFQMLKLSPSSSTCFPNGVKDFKGFHLW